MTVEVSLSVDKIYHQQVCPLNWREITVTMAANKQSCPLRKTLYHCQYLIRLKRKKNEMKVKKYILFLGKKNSTINTNNIACKTTKIKQKNSCGTKRTTKH